MRLGGFVTRILPGNVAATKNTNGFVRQDFPKRIDLSVYSQAELDGVADELNDPPREKFGWRKSTELLYTLLREATGTATR